ncbi:acetate and sugar kinases/Hsc70/actin family protein [Sphaerimonospora thailandensis]|uniref:virulence factor SrfB n=1 Tax=Sphaerimonospora thailandensis TaxID=795644 RepID=UPI0019500088|nr:virulence factor SrfB [Sphaerimonospora thailandensis]
MEFVFRGGDGRLTTELRVGPGGDRLTLPFPVMRFHGESAAIVRSVRIVPAYGTEPAASGSALWLAGQWTPEIPQNGLRLREGLWWRPVGAIQVGRSELPPGRTHFDWTVSYQLDDGSTLMREATGGLTVDTTGDPGRLDVHEGWIALDYGTTTTSITMFDQKHQIVLLGLPRTQAAIIRRRLGELFEGGESEGIEFGLSVSEWRRMLEAAGNLLASASAPRLDPLTVARNVLHSDLYRLLIALERQVVESQRPELALGLHRLYSSAFAMPPIREQRLVSIPLHAEKETIASAVDVLSLQPLNVRMAADGIRLDSTEAGQAPVEVRYQPGLKQYIGASRPLPGLPPDHPHPVSTDDVLAAAWQCLLKDKVAKFCQDHPDEYSTKPITHAVVTYPTAAPPQTRLDVEKLARRIGLDRVVTDYDEATAAAMFYLMRDFAGDPAVGIEAYRARSRRDGAAQTWHRNILVVDIGGGTTDIALIGITLHDETDFESGKGRDVQGRYYVLRPTIRAKAGRAQLGGDRITLGIFNHLKATLADLLLTRDARIVQGEYPPFLSEGRYREKSLLSRVEDSKMEALRDDLIDAVIPTRWVKDPTDKQAVRQRFRLLWDEAEQAKTQQSVNEGDYLVRHVGELLNLSGKAKEAAQDLPDVTIAHAEISSIIEEVVRSAFDIGLNVVKRSLIRPSDGGPETLDTVMVSGGSSALPQIQRILREVFTGAGGDIQWNPMNVVYEPAFAKTGTSIGACWAEHVRRKGFDRARNARQRVGRGLTELHIDVDNLFHALPNTFVLDALDGQSWILFHIGAEFDQIGAAGGVEGRRRSEWVHTTEDLTVYRQPFSLEEKRDVWGNLNLATMRGELGEHWLDLARWQRRVKVQFEINERSLITAYFCEESGPAHIVGFDGVSPMTGLVEVGDDGVPVVQADIVVNPQSAGGMAAAGQVVFPRGARLTDRLVVGGSDRPVAGLISGALPKDVPVDGGWSFYRRDSTDPDRMVQIGRVMSAPEAGRMGPDIVAALDQDGRLTTTPSYPAYQQAKSMAEVLERPGAVLGYAMKPGTADIDERFDPFNGTH